MKLASALEGGLTGVTTLTLLQEALHKIDSKTPQPFLHKSGVIKKLKKSSGKPGKNGKNNKLYIALAGELLVNAAYFGLSGLGKRKNAVLTGGLLGAAAGLGVAFLNEPDHDNSNRINGEQMPAPDDTQKKVLTVALYTAGGLLAGVAIKRLNKKMLKKLGKTIKGK